VNKLDTREFASRQLLDEALANSVAERLRDAVAQNGHAVLVVSGGSTPLNFFKLLSAIPLAWRKVTVLLADERWVPPEHSDSNEKRVRENLLVGPAAAASFQSLKTDHANASEAANSVDLVLAALGRFDLVILGMGNDGHTASLFPGATALPEGLDMASGRHCVAVDPPAAPHQRLSMTLPRLLDSERIFIHITGADKKRTLDVAREQNDPLQLPIAAVLHQQRTPVTLYYAR